MYHPEVVARAADSTRGIVSRVKFLNIAAIRECLDEWGAEHAADMRRREKPIALPEPPRDLEMEKRISQGLRELSDHLKRGFSPGSI